MKALIAIALMMAATVPALASDLNKYDSNAMFDLLKDHGIKPVQEVEIAELTTGTVRCQLAPANQCEVQLASGMINDFIDIDGSTAQTLIRLLRAGGATLNLARLPGTITASKVQCVVGGIVPQGIAGAHCEVTPAIIAD